MSEFGVFSEVGKLRKVIVHRPGLEMRRLTPTNCQELLFDDVIWSRKARQEHDAFVDLMHEEFDVDVMRVHELLQDVVDDPEGRAYILDRKLVPNEVGVGGAVELRAWMNCRKSLPIHRFRSTATAKPAVYARQLMLDLWWCHSESHVLARSAQGDAVLDGHLQISPQIQGRRLYHLVG
jgi:arginine deiminase